MEMDLTNWLIHTYFHQNQHARTSVYTIHRKTIPHPVFHAFSGTVTELNVIIENPAP